MKINPLTMLATVVFGVAASGATIAADDSTVNPNRDKVDTNVNSRADAPGSGGATFSTFEQVDTNGDGSIDRNEAARAPQIKSDFDLIDTNGDKTITRAEWSTYRNIGR